MGKEGCSDITANKVQPGEGVPTAGQGTGEMSL